MQQRALASHPFLRPPLFFADGVSLACRSPRASTLVLHCGRNSSRTSLHKPVTCQAHAGQGDHLYAHSIRPSRARLFNLIPPERDRFVSRKEIILPTSSEDASDKSLDLTNESSARFSVLTAVLQSLEWVLIVGSLAIELAKKNVLAVPEKWWGWQGLLLLGALVINLLLRGRQVQQKRPAAAQPQLGSQGDDRVFARLRLLEDEHEREAKTVRAMTRQLEKLGIRFRLTRRTLLDPVKEALDIAEQSAAQAAMLAERVHHLEEALTKAQELMIVMQDQQARQLKVIAEALAKVSSANKSTAERVGNLEKAAKLAKELKQAALLRTSYASSAKGASSAKTQRASSARGQTASSAGSNSASSAGVQSASSPNDQSASSARDQDYWSSKSRKTPASSTAGSRVPTPKARETPMSKSRELAKKDSPISSASKPGMNAQLQAGPLVVPPGSVGLSESTQGFSSPPPGTANGAPLYVTSPADIVQAYGFGKEAEAPGYENVGLMNSEGLDSVYEYEKERQQLGGLWGSSDWDEDGDFYYEGPSTSSRDIADVSSQGMLVSSNVGLATPGLSFLGGGPEGAAGRMVSVAVEEEPLDGHQDEVVHRDGGSPLSQLRNYHTKEMYRRVTIPHAQRVLPGGPPLRSEGDIGEVEVVDES